MLLPKVKIEVIQTQSEVLTRDMEMLGPEKALELWIEELREENPAIERWMNSAVTALEDICKGFRKGKALVELESAQTSAVLLFLTLYKAIRAQIEIDQLNDTLE
jgi:predicted glycosyl hydrolase (DUF1957 family)